MILYGKHGFEKIDTDKTFGSMSVGNDNGSRARITHSEKVAKPALSSAESKKVSGKYIYVYTEFCYEEKPERALAIATFDSLAEFRESLDDEQNLNKKFKKATKKFKENVSFSEYDDSYDGDLTIVNKDKKTGQAMSVGTLSQRFIKIEEKLIEIDESEL